ncbi:cytochrome b N-terminal domain-containing protein [Isoptericola sp. b490]|uniref:cytochrome b N-terminal domain-containing protein n=1 Tax=Actinotalea lenta TaxID=3064654 RepID=UPI0027142ABA|nr:cytochrome b N-terminal domain-containing protein [Isoptericola sp. b490]MDO8120724.1 cytochrome b N-terminal domain-containing protein [Isoptericola sp. b490]
MTTSTRTSPGTTASANPEQSDVRRGRGRAVLDVVDERLGISALEYPVPGHANNLAWSLGGITAASLGILIVTGILLVQFYSPTPETANASVRHIVTGVWGGGFVRGVHFWAAQAMYVTALLHLGRVFVSGSYKRPREGNYLVGVAMLGLVTLAIFTGTVLKWDQEGFEALGHNIEIGNLLGGAGLWFSPQFADQVPILVRLYAAHTVIVPGLILVLAVLHGLLVKKHRISPHPALPTDASGTQAPADEPTAPFTHHLRRIAAFGLALLGILGILAVLLPPAVGAPPVEGIEITRPPWMFWWVFTLENWIGLSGILWGELAFFALLVALPFIDRNPNRLWRRRPVAVALGSVLMVLLAVLTVLMVVTPAKQHLGMGM